VQYEEFEARYVEVMVHPDHVTGALGRRRELKPIAKSGKCSVGSIMLFDRVDRNQLARIVMCAPQASDCLSP